MLYIKQTWLLNHVAANYHGRLGKLEKQDVLHVACSIFLAITVRLAIRSY